MSLYLDHDHYAAGVHVAVHKTTAVPRELTPNILTNNSAFAPGKFSVNMSPAKKSAEPQAQPGQSTSIDLLGCLLWHKKTHSFPFPRPMNIEIASDRKIIGSNTRNKRENNDCKIMIWPHV